MIVFFLLVVFGLISGAIASGKRRNFFGWFCIGFIAPLLSWILLLVLPPGDSLTDSYVPEPEPGPYQIQQQQLAAAQAKSKQALDTLARLTDLKDRGALDPQEFEAKKTELLANI